MINIIEINMIYPRLDINLSHVSAFLINSPIVVMFCQF
jgi:hypothetical protein